MADNETALVWQAKTDLSRVKNRFGESQVITLCFRVKILQAYGGFSEVFLEERATENRS